MTEPPRFLPPEGARPTAAPGSLLGPRPADALPPAAPGRRAVALVVDYGILPLVVAVAVGLLVGGMVGDEPAFTDTYVEDGELVVDEYAWPVVAGMGAAALYALVVPWVLLGLWGGRTIGRRLVGIRLVTDTGGRLSLGRAFLREIAVKGGLGLFTLPLLASFLWPVWDRRRRTLHDIICSTRAVDTRAGLGEAAAAGPGPRAGSAFGSAATRTTLPPPPAVDDDLDGDRPSRDDDDLARRIGLGG